MVDERTIRATFEMLDFQDAPYDEPAEGPKLTRVTVHKRYSGAIDGEGVANVFTAQGADGGGYVASERVEGRLEGRRGTFVIQHGGLADGADQRTFGSIVPNSGTHDLAGIAGDAAENEQGVLTLTYSLP